MRSRLSLAIATLAALVAGLVAGTQTPVHAITFGVPDAGEHPNVGSFIGEFTDPATGDTSLFQLCTGTLIAEDVVLSASHCFVGLPTTITSISFTLNDVIDEDRDGVVDAEVALLSGTPVTHPLFGRRANNPYDIAVFLLDAPVTDIEPAPLAPAGTFDRTGLRNETFTAVGYGTVRSSIRQGPQGFEAGWRREKADQELLSVTKAWATLSMNPSTGNGGTCYGDSGGPHFLGTLVVSITVTGDAMCKATDKTYRVDTPWARAFLSQFVTVP
jgi:Trypsin